MPKLRTEIYRDNFPLEEITELLHYSYKKHLDHDRKFLASRQTVEQTRQRLEGAVCVVAYDGDKMVGTSSFRVYDKTNDKNRKWYEDDYFILAGQVGVHPDYRESNVFLLMNLKLSKTEEMKKCQSILIDTSVKATELVENYLKMGFQIVDLVSWPSTNYYSYFFRKPITGKKYSDKYCKFRFKISSILCKIKYNENGKKRFE